MRIHIATGKKKKKSSAVVESIFSCMPPTETATLGQAVFWFCFDSSCCCTSEWILEGSWRTRVSHCIFITPLGVERQQSLCPSVLAGKSFAILIIIAPSTIVHLRARIYIPIHFISIQTPTYFIEKSNFEVHEIKKCRYHAMHIAKELVISSIMQTENKNKCVILLLFNF